MGGLYVALYVFLGLLALNVLFALIASHIIFRKLLVRTSRDIWGRHPSMPDDENYCRLYKNAEEWGRLNSDKKQDVQIENEGLKLFGEFYDFGSDKAVIILPGRMEACTYSYHYAYPYAQAGWNVLVIDGRAHGLSDGRLNYLGFREYRDVQAWAEMLKERFGVKKVVLHGVCIGSSAAMFACAADKKPDNIAGMVADGMFPCFFDSAKRHMRYDKRPIFPFLYFTMFWIRLVCRVEPKFDGPFKRVKNMRLPILFLHSKEDLFSPPSRAKEMFDNCPSDKKYLKWFEHGWHSRLRLENTEAYDEAVKAFLSTL